VRNRSICRRLLRPVQLARPTVPEKARMERKFYEKYTSLKKRKLLDEGLERKREEELKELYDAMKDWVRGLEKDKEELSELLADNEDELEKARQDFLADIRARDSEILRLKQLLDEKTEKKQFYCYKV